jgi:hypothetical protein
MADAVKQQQVIMAGIVRGHGGSTLRRSCALVVAEIQPKVTNSGLTHPKHRESHSIPNTPLLVGTESRRCGHREPYVWAHTAVGVGTETPLRGHREP